MLTIGFEQIFLLRSGFTTDVAEVIDTFVYSRGILSGQWGFAAAVALLKAVIGALLIFISNRAAKKFGEEGLY